jgi:ribosomal protein S18 acetylase RimI-like enzyme
MCETEQIEKRLTESIHDGPFGPIEFNAHIYKNNQGYELFISHLKVHKRYRRQGLGHEAIQTASRICFESNLPIRSVSIDMLNENGVEEFLKQVGFTSINKHSNQISGQGKIQDLL